MHFYDQTLAFLYTVLHLRDKGLQLIVKCNNLQISKTPLVNALLFFPENYISMCDKTMLRVQIIVQLLCKIGAINMHYVTLCKLCSIRYNCSYYLWGSDMNLFMMIDLFVLQLLTALLFYCIHPLALTKLGF